MMLEEILEIADQAETPEAKLCAIRACIQAAALRSLHELGAFEKLCMTGESARHFASGAPEYMTDLEFGLVDKKGYKPEQWLFAVKRRLHFMGLDARIAFARKASIHAGWVKVTGLLAEDVGFRIAIDIAPIEPVMCKVKLVDMAGECFGIRYMS
ncbi:MAG: hypothetical protein CVV53_00360 [Spirochaetae bacterium HGW-Spirochaetae-9]|nr:MAG: hypothetical protein CVV53_00360 [Spirochaetae bacterium HGW-Spirochaetae-9]